MKRVASSQQAVDRGRFRAFEVASVAAFFAVSILLLFNVIAGLRHEPDFLLFFPLVALAGYAAADFSSGLVHWLADTYGSVDTPLLGAKFVEPFREHHRDQEAITRHDFVEANSDNCFVSLFVLVPGCFLPTESSPWAALVGLFVFMLAQGVLLTSIAHGWSHMQRPPRVARLLAWLGLVISHDHHALHHRGDHSTHYCITTGWLNPVLDKLGFFRKLERMLDWVGIPRSSDRDD